MKARYTHILTVLCLSISLPGLAHADDLFERNKPVVFQPMQMVTPDQTVGGYPIPNLGANLALIQLNVMGAGSTNGGPELPIGFATMIDARQNILYAAMFMEANLGYNGSAIDWTDEPCKGDTFLWKRSIGGRFSNINCVTISPRTNFAPDYPTVIDVRFTRYGGSARRLGYTVSVNPEAFGLERDAERQPEANGWHKTRIANDPKKVEFVDRLSKWAEEFQNRMDAAFEKKREAFSTLPDLATYF